MMSRCPALGVGKAVPLGSGETCHQPVTSAPGCVTGGTRVHGRPHPSEPRSLSQAPT